MILFVYKIYILFEHIILLITNIVCHQITKNIQTSKPNTHHLPKGIEGLQMPLSHQLILVLMLFVISMLGSSFA